MSEVVKVCNKCFKEKCNCNNNYKIEIDKNILPIIQELNNKGYGTRFCCEGHPIYFYIYFKYNFEELKNCPIKNIKVEFKKNHGYYNKDNTLNCSYIFYSVANPYTSAFIKKYPEMGEKLKNDLLNELAVWVHSLPRASVDWREYCVCYKE